jgi:benzil reductase ((S)-benzoin forming)
MNYYIITGTSSGIGEAIAKKLILEGHSIFCISRKLNEALTDLASSVQSNIWYFEADLGNTGGIPGLMDEIFSLMEFQHISAIALINNAGTLDPVAMAGNYDAEELAQQIKVNLLAPMLITDCFIRHTSSLKVTKSVINIGSGAATSPYAGWGPYCSSKAGLEMFTRTTSLEQKSKPHPVRIISVLPGVVDTGMQNKLRNSDAEDFPMKPRFEQLYQENLLSRPQEVADKIIRLIFDQLPGESEIIDLRKI